MNETEDYAVKVARAANIPLAQARERLAFIEADPELREAMWQVRGQASATIVVNVRREGQEITVAVAPDPGMGNAAARRRTTAENLGLLRGEVARIELAQARGRTPRTALPFLARYLVRR